MQDDTVRFKCSVLPARAFLNALHAQREVHGAAAVELSGAVSERGGFVPLAWIDAFLERHLVTSWRCAREAKTLMRAGVRVRHVTHGLGRVKAVLEQNAQVVFDSHPSEVVYYRRDHDLQGRLEVEATSLPEDSSKPGEDFLAAVASCHVGGATPAFPESHGAWDTAALGMPEAWRTGSFEALVNAIPVQATERIGDLPDESLPRAGVVLAHLCHGYYYFGGSNSVPPDHIFDAWREVARRLGRPQPCLHVNDLALCNWQVQDPALAKALVIAAIATDPRPGVAAGAAALSNEAPSVTAGLSAKDSVMPRTVWNLTALTQPQSLRHLALLAPVFGGRKGNVASEDNFICTFTHIHMVTAPLVELCTASQEAAMANAQELLAALLTAIKECIDAATRSFANIDPNPASETHCDPVEWARTVATIAPPFAPECESASGLQMPFFHCVDVFIGRTSYATTYGSQILQERHKNLPNNQRDFLAALGKVSVRQYIEGADSPKLAAIWNSVVNAYVGERGWLGVHALKASGYLEVAVKVGRVQMNATACDVTDWRARQWLAPIEHMHESRSERYECRVAFAGHQRCSFAHAHVTKRVDASAGGGGHSGGGGGQASRLRNTSAADAGVAEDFGVEVVDDVGPCCPFSGKRGSHSGCPFGFGSGKEALPKPTLIPEASPKPPSASKLVVPSRPPESVHVHIDLSKAFVQYEPGDIVSLCCENAEDVILQTLRAMNSPHKLSKLGRLDPRQFDQGLLKAARRRLVMPNATWIAFCESIGQPLSNGVMISLFEVLRHGQLTTLPPNAVQRFLYYCPHINAMSLVAQRILFHDTGVMANSHSLADLFHLIYTGKRAQLSDEGRWMFEETVLCDLIEPLAPRNYSAASVPDGPWPSKLDLCVGRQQWTQRVHVTAPSGPSKQAAGETRLTEGRRNGSFHIGPSPYGEGKTLNHASQKFKLLAAAAAAGKESATTVKTETRVGVMTHTLLDRVGSGAQPIKLRVEPSPRFHLPIDERKPLLLFAAGTGIAPFRGFLQQRLATPEAGPVTLYFGCRDATTAPFVDELESMAASAPKGAFRLHVCLSRAQPRETPLARVYEHAGRVPELMEAHEDELWSTFSSGWALPAPNSGGSDESSRAHAPERAGAAVYTCGFAGFAHAVEYVLFDLVARRWAAAEATVRGGVRASGDAAHRLFAKLARTYISVQYSMHVFGGGSGDLDAQEGMWSEGVPVSEVARRRGGKHGLDDAWWIYQDVVYDVSRYAHLHPGGDKIILDKAGRDATFEFRKAHASNLREYESYMEVYRIGKLRLPYFPPSMDRRPWLSLVSAMHYVTEVCNVVRTEAQATNLAVDSGPCPYRQPVNEPLLAYQKVVQRDGYLDMVAVEVSRVADVLTNIGGSLADASSIAAELRAWTQTEAPQLTAAQVKELSMLDEARSWVLSQPSASGKTNFAEGAHALGTKLIALASGELEGIQLCLVECVAYVEQQEGKAFTEESSAGALLALFRKAARVCTQAFLPIQAALERSSPVDPAHALELKPTRRSSVETQSRASIQGIVGHSALLPANTHLSLAAHDKQSGNRTSIDDHDPEDSSPDGLRGHGIGLDGFNLGGVIESAMAHLVIGHGDQAMAGDNGFAVGKVRSKQEKQLEGNLVRPKSTSSGGSIDGVVRPKAGSSGARKPIRIHSPTNQNDASPKSNKARLGSLFVPRLSMASNMLSRLSHAKGHEIAQVDPVEDACDAAREHFLEHPFVEDSPQLEPLFPVYAMPMRTFLALHTMKTWEEALAEGLLVKWEPSMGHLNFLSHQWLGHSNPDPEAEQLGAAQEIMSRIMSAQDEDELSVLFPSPAEWEKYKRADMGWYNNPTDIQEAWSLAAFQGSIREGYVWLDYHSVPQTRNASLRSEAIQSIACYVARATNFFVLAPNTLHESTGKRVGLGSWHQRGWCRVEDCCAVLRCVGASARRPIIISSGSELHVENLFDKLTHDCTRTNSIFNGEFTIDSDRLAIMAVLKGALQAKMHSLLDAKSLYHYRWTMFVAPHLCSDSVKHDGLGNGDISVEDFLARYGFSSVSECPPKIPFMPLFCAAAEGNIKIVRELLTAKADPNQWDATSSISPMHGASTYGDPDCLEALLLAGGDAGSQSKIQLTPLHCAAAGGHSACARLLIKHKAGIDPVRKDTGRTPLHMAALNGHHVIVAMLLDAGANAEARDTDSRSPLELMQDTELKRWGVAFSTRLGQGQPRRRPTLDC